ncbi:putative clathrin assembly protein At2g25430 [Eucalyptus grandis]|uniref:putative clathrin assembly protein At2g25430 n=1 Tax=Eucalyptus grandis TaxID=71139 RepID=UPI00192EA4A0|nr:putative clathrin assembly protein At2g25430 [Eucalyptus grandis]
MHRRFQRFFTSLKEHGCVSYAKIATASGFCDVDLLLIKATAPDDLPLPERYVHELLKIFSISPCSFRSFSLSFTRRFRSTHCWRVALKCLLLVHRLLRSLPEDSPLRSELLWTRSARLLSLNPCHFRDASSSASEDYTSFIRAYAGLLDEALNIFSIETILSEDGEFPENLSDRMREVGKLLEILPQLQSLIDRVMDCRPIGSAARSFIIKSAMKHIIRDSFICYTTFRRDIVVLLENLFHMPHRNCISAFGIYKKAALQAQQLSEFYDWCKARDLCGPYENPFIDRIPHIQIQALESFLDGMWQLTDQSPSSSSSTASPSSSIARSRSSLTEDDGEFMPRGDVNLVSMQWEKFEDNALVVRSKEDEREPLIKLEDGEKAIGWDWEALLEASINLSPMNQQQTFEEAREDQSGKEKEWQLQIHNNPGSHNPFY